MFNKRARNRKKDITDRMFQRETTNYLEDSGLKCGDYCPFVDLIDRTIKLMTKVGGEVYKDVQELILPSNSEHLENNETSYQELVRNRFQSMGLSWNPPTKKFLEDYGIHITKDPGFAFM